MQSEDLDHHAAEEFPVVTGRVRAVNHNLEEGEAELSIFHEDQATGASEELDQGSLVDSSALVGELMEEAILLVILQLQELDHAEEVCCLEEWQEGVQQECLLVDMDVIDSDQVLDNLVTSGLKYVRGEKLNQDLNSLVDGLKSLSCLSSTIEREGSLVKDVRLEGLEVDHSFEGDDTTLTDVVEGLVIDVSGLLNIEEERDASASWQANLILLLDFEAG